MNWRYKAALKYALSALPQGEHVDYLFQRYVTKTLSDELGGFEGVMENARAHIWAVRSHLRIPVSQAIFYEFGAGWLLAIPLALFCSGVNHQIVVDIRRLARPHLVDRAVEKIHGLGAEAGLQRKPRERVARGNSPDFLESLRTSFGIVYRAPCDARATGIEPGSVDVITSTNTLEHIP